MVFLLHLIAVDSILLDKCDTGLKKYYNYLGIMVFLIGVVAFISAYEIFYSIHSGRILSILLGLMMTFIIWNYYRFLFITISSIASYNPNTMLDSKFSYQDIHKFYPIIIIASFLSIGMMLLLFDNQIMIQIQGEDNRYVGFVSKIILLRDLIGTSSVLVFSLLYVTLFILPLIIRLYVKEIRNGQYEYVKNNFENSMIKDQYEYCKDAYEIMLKNAAKPIEIQRFDIENSFVKNPFIDRIIELNGEVSTPLIMSEVIKEDKVNDNLVQCSYCKRLTIKFVEEEFGRKCLQCKRTAVTDDLELDYINKYIYQFVLKNSDLKVEKISIFIRNGGDIIENDFYPSIYLPITCDRLENNSFSISKGYGMYEVEELLLKLYSYVAMNESDYYGLGMFLVFNYFESKNRVEKLAQIEYYINHYNSVETDAYKSFIK